MGSYSIKDIEQLSGIKAHTIRIWEQRYQLLAPKRTDTNIRFYDDEQLKFILNVSLLLKNGYKISKIGAFTKSEFFQAVEKVYEQTLIHDSEIHLELDSNDLMVSMIDMNASKFHGIYETSVKNRGFESTITSLIYPFLEKVGMLWSLNQINPAHEHFISCLIRQKIISAIDRLPENQQGKKFLLFLPEGEHHEMGLLMAQYILKKNGAQVFYLGQSLPENDLAIAINTIEPDSIFTFIIDPTILGKARQLIEKLKLWCNKSSILLACRPTDELLKLESDRIFFLHKMEDLKKHI